MDLSRRSFLKVSGAAASGALVLPYIPSGKIFRQKLDGKHVHSSPYLAILEHYDGTEARWIFLVEPHPPEIHVEVNGRLAKPFDGNTWELGIPTKNEKTYAKFSAGRRETQRLEPYDLEERLPLIDRNDHDLARKMHAAQHNERVVVYYRQFAGPGLQTRNGEAEVDNA